MSGINAIIGIALVSVFIAGLVLGYKVGVRRGIAKQRRNSQG